MTNNTIATKKGMANNIPNNKNIFQSGITLSYIRHFVSQAINQTYNTVNPNDVITKNWEGA